MVLKLVLFFLLRCKTVFSIEKNPGISARFSMQKLRIQLYSTLKYYFRCKVLRFFLRKVKNLVFGVKTGTFLLRNGLFQRKKTRNFRKIFLYRNSGFHCKILFQMLLFSEKNSVKYSFLLENLVFVVKNLYFYYKTVFSNTKKLSSSRKFLVLFFTTSFSLQDLYTETQVSTVKYYFRCKVLFSTRKPRFRC